jgi:hypothetical protein
MSKIKPKDVLDRLKDVIVDKEDDYGSSWEKVGVIKRVMADEDGPNVISLDEGDLKENIIISNDVEGKVVPLRVPADFFDDRDSVEFVKLADTPQNDSTFEQNVDDLITRLLDKLIRAYNLTLLKDEAALENESTLDAWEDLTGYASMGTSLVENETEE